MSSKKIKESLKNIKYLKIFVNFVKDSDIFFVIFNVLFVKRFFKNLIFIWTILDLVTSFFLS